MTPAGEKVALLAEIIRVSSRGATLAEISNELSLSPQQARIYLNFLKSKRLVVAGGNGLHSPSEKGLAYLSTYDEASNLVDIEEASAYYSGANAHRRQRSVYWREEISARMREIIDRQ